MQKYLSFFTVLIVLFVSCKDNTQRRSKVQENKLNYANACENLVQLDSLIRVDSLNGYWYSCRAEIHFDKGVYYNALFDVDKAIALKGKNIPDLLLLSDIYFMLGNVNFAFSAINEAEKIDNEDYTVYYAFGKHHFRTGNFEFAKAYFARSIGMQPINPQSYFALGQMAVLEGDTIRAIAYFQNAIQSDHEFSPAYLQLAIINMDRNPELVPQYLLNAININEKNPNALFLLGVYYQENEEYDKAKECYIRAYPYDTNNKMTCFNLGYIYLTELMYFDSAAYWFDKTLSIEPNFKEAIHNYNYSLELLNEGKR